MIDKLIYDQMGDDLDRACVERDEAQSSLDDLSARFTELIKQNAALAAENERLESVIKAAQEQLDPEAEMQNFLSVFKIPESSEIKWYPDRKLFLTPIPLWKKHAVGMTNALEGYIAALASHPVPAQSPALAALNYAFEHCDGDSDSMLFLHYWNEGEFDVLRGNWRDIPDEVFIRADPLFKPIPSHEPQVFQHRGCTGSIECSVADGCLFGKIQFIDDIITYEGNTLPELEQAFKVAVADYLTYEVQDRGVVDHE